ncbi:hypothetical protein LJR220_002766 [Bradyrhizobium sp. LjRoot220]|uniref:hypothetical protein n=1 Tax=Bradyrhizobium sp. LjRoot220 TaxID=3342284 RepID=UPI003ECF7FA9
MAGPNSTWFRYAALTSGVGRKQAIAIVLLSIAVSAWLIGRQVLHASWGMIDDHDTIRLIGAGNHHLPIGQYFHVLFTQTELGAIGKYTRFRPFYYPALLGEAVLWGDNVHLWYASRVGLLAVFIAGIWIVVARHLGIIIGLAVVLVVMRAPFWGDVWARLGPGEIYGAAGLGLWLVGIEGMFTSSRSRVRNLSLLAVTIGTVMMVGSKETLFPFAGYSFCAIAVYIYLHRDSLAAKVHLAFILAYSSLSAVAIGLALSRAGQDFLGQPVGLGERLARILSPLGDSGLQFLLPALLLLGVTAGVVRWLSRDPRDFRNLWLGPAAVYCAGVALVWSLYLSQYIGYSGKWPTGYRYDFPGVFALPALVVISVAFATTVLRPFPWLNAAVRGCALAGAATAIVMALLRLPFPVSTAVAANIDLTAKFQKTLSELSALANKDPNMPIVLRANGAWTYEKIVSVAIYLHGYYKIANPIAVKFYPEPNPNPQLAGLGQIIKQWELSGGRDEFVALATIAERAKSGCLSIGFDGPAEPSCSSDFRM